MRHTILLIGSLLLGIYPVAYSAPLPQIEASFAPRLLPTGCRVSCDVNAVLLDDVFAVVQARKTRPGNAMRFFVKDVEFPEFPENRWHEVGTRTVPPPCLAPSSDPFDENCADPVFARKVAVASFSRDYHILFASAEPKADRAPIVYPYFAGTQRGVEIEQRANIDLSQFTNASSPVLDIAASNDLVAISLTDGVYVFRLGVRNLFYREGAPIPTRAGVVDFGATLAMNREWLAVGAPARNGHVGAVYVYRLRHRIEEDTLVPFWELQQQLQPPQDQVQAFGAALAMSGNRLIVGAPQYARDSGRAGLAYVYVLGDDQRWRRHQTLTDPYKPGTPGVFTERRFGTSVAVHGTRLMIGVGFGPERFDSRSLAFLAQQRSDNQYRLTAEFRVGRSVERVQLSCDTALTVGFTRLGGDTQVYELPDFARGEECTTP